MTNHNSQVSGIVSFCLLRAEVAVPSSNDCLPNESRLETAATKSKLREGWEVLEVRELWEGWRGGSCGS